MIGASVLRAACIALALLVAVAPPPVRAEPLPAELRERLALSVAQIRARDCPDGDRSGTGFVYGAPGRIVTALHVVAGCRTLSAFFEKHGGRIAAAQVARVLTGPDLALLDAPEAPGAPLPRAATPPEVNAPLEALGYYLGVPSMDNKPLRVTFGATRLAQMLPDGLREELRRSGAVDLDLDVVRMDGHLLPGLSGAPILTLAGEVAAVGSGGLQSGAASVSFGVPAIHLDALMASTEPLSAADRAVPGLFAAPLAPEGAQPGAAQALRCGGLDFAQVGVRNFFDLAESTDDPASFAYFLGETGLDAATLAGFRYVIWAPTEGGAALATPDWMPLRQGPTGDHCVAEAPGGGLRIELGGARVGDFEQAQAASVAFETAVVQRSGRGYWELAPLFSYLAPLERGDGLVANRKTAIGVDAAGGTALAFETLMTRGPVFTGAAAIADRFDVFALSYCEEAPADPQCAPVAAHLPEIYQAFLGVFLSTFPIY
ncbi:MAG: serine protease [Rubrimonas sp.]|uniref:S1 family peptidase n=1 Tax=Rubrimonas sp. TaxID=2036015 RepID=UPI002FDC7CD1